MVPRIEGPIVMVNKFCNGHIDLALICVQVVKRSSCEDAVC